MSQITLTQIKSAYPYLTSSFDSKVADYRALQGRWKRLKAHLNSLPKRDSIVIMQDKIEILQNIHEVKERMLELRQWFKSHVKPTADRLRQTARAVDAVAHSTPTVAPVINISPEKIAQIKQLIDTNPAVKSLLQAIASKLHG
jgi:hypothetical protein